MKRVFAIHDMSGVGKCSLTAAIPIISAAGIECNPVPTAILSTHTGNISGYTFRDLTEDLIPYTLHWKKIGIKPDAVYSGYLGSEKQINAVKNIISDFSDESTVVVIDPAMADSGILYKGFDSSFVESMKDLCRHADIITPNLTEAAMITGTEYKSDYDFGGYILPLVERLFDYTNRYVVITGVTDRENKSVNSGCIVADKLSENGCLYKVFNTPRIPGTYYGTGDIFASVLTSFVTIGADPFTAAETALNFTYKSIEQCYNEGTDPRLGVPFENHLSEIIKLSEEYK